MNKPERANVKRMNELFDTFDLTQHVTKPPDKCGNILDLTSTKQSQNYLNIK